MRTILFLVTLGLVWYVIVRPLVQGVRKPRNHGDGDFVDYEEVEEDR